MDFSKATEFAKALADKSEAFLTTLSGVLTKSEVPGAVHDFIAAHFPQALGWEAELHHAVDFCLAAELKAMPSIDEVLLFLSTVAPKPAV